MRSIQERTNTRAEWPLNGHSGSASDFDTRDHAKLSIIHAHFPPLHFDKSSGMLLSKYEEARCLKGAWHLHREFSTNFRTPSSLGCIPSTIGQSIT